MLRKTKIICTLGPSAQTEEMIQALAEAGMNGARFNFSHGDHETHLAIFHRLQAVRQATGLPIAAILDTKGPEIRIRSFRDGPVTLKPGGAFTLTTREIEGDAAIVSVTYPRLHEELTPGVRILLDDGLIALRVEKIQGQDILCQVETGGILSANKSINIPGVSIQLPALTERDREDLRFGAENGFDYVAASFVRRASDVEAIREELAAHGGETIKIIAKIENQEGVDHIDDIIAAADGIMVARGDLGVEIPATHVPVIQKELIEKTVAAGKLVVIATQMLDSMIRNPRPTRAEVSDVANAVFDMADCVMLSGETASGKYPLEALKMMVDICRESEDSMDYWKRIEDRCPAVEPEGMSVDDATAHNCCLMAMDLKARAILTVTKTGHTARMIARFRPQCPVMALTLTETVRRQMALAWGVAPYLTMEVWSTDQVFSLCAGGAMAAGLVEPGDRVVVTAGVPLGRGARTNMIRAQVIGEE